METKYLERRQVSNPQRTDSLEASDRKAKALPRN